MPVKPFTTHTVSKLIDHGLLRPGASDRELEAGIDEAIRADVASICIQPHYLRRLIDRLKGTTIRSSTVIGFPHGSHTATTKLHEAHDALAKGCEELDAVINIGKARSGDFSYVEEEVEALVSITHDAEKKIKIIIETCYLSEREKIRLCSICSDLRADWVKTSTGFGSAGASVLDVELLRRHCAPEVEIKASGGIRTLAQVLELHAAGASRIGTSSTLSILAEMQAPQ